MLCVNPRSPTRGKEKGGKGRDTYKLNIKPTLLIILIIREIKYTKPILSFPELGGGALASHQQLPVRHQAVLDWLSSRWELDSGMHGLGSGSGSQAGQ